MSDLRGRNLGNQRWEVQHHTDDGWEAIGEVWKVGSWNWTTSEGGRARTKKEAMPLLLSLLGEPEDSSLATQSTDGFWGTSQEVEISEEPFTGPDPAYFSTEEQRGIQPYEKGDIIEGGEVVGCHWLPVIVGHLAPGYWRVGVKDDNGIVQWRRSA